MVKNAAQHESKSLKTFYLYAAIVLVLICISLTFKLFYIIQQSKFDPAHNFILAIVQNADVKEIIAFHPQTPSLSVLVVSDPHTPFTMLAKEDGIASDGYIQLGDSTQAGTDVTTSLWSSILHTATWKSDLTIVDKIRLLLLVKSITLNNKTIQQISFSDQNPNINTLIANTLTDQDLSTENISIQVINATDTPGLGQRLGRILTNLGANIVDVSSSQKTQQKTTIAYFGNQSYTLYKLQKLLGVDATKLTKEQIADIVIIIGNDNSKTESF